MAIVKRSRKKLKRNAGEVAIEAQLKSSNLKYSFEPHSFKYDIPATYTPDFMYKNKKGKDVYLEIKGYHPGMAIWLSKINHFILANPKVDFRIVFLDAKKKVNKHYKSNLGDWAEKKGIKWADKGIIPKEWL